MNQVRRSWTASVEESCAKVMAGWPTDVQKTTISYFLALALEVGSALEKGRQPPGDPMTEVGGYPRRSLQVAGDPIVFEYLIVEKEKEIRISVAVWAG